MMVRRTGPAGVAAGFAMLWALLLVVLAALWIRSPFLGAGTAFAVWSVPAALGSLASWTWLRRRAIEQIPLSRGLFATVVALWVGALLLGFTGIGDQWALDGLIMRQELLRISGRAVGWLPMAFGLVLAVAGLAASLEARYRIVNAPEKPATPRAEGK